jgi:hypothetical protein
MDKQRIRSPNYPALSLPDAINKVTALYQSLHTHSAPREVVAKGMGYTGLNGASATAISALHKYGLLEKHGEDIKVSERALRILHPESAQERGEAIREAAMAPVLFAELAERFPGRLPNEELLRNYLVRNKFAPSAAQAVVLSYRETSELVEREMEGHDSGNGPAPEAHMQSASSVGVNATHIRNIQQNQSDTRQIARYDFEGGAYIQLVVSGNIDTETALDMIDPMLKLKRMELKAKPKTSPPPLGEAELDKDSDA